MSFQDKVAEKVKRIPARRWIEYSSRFGKDTQDVMTDGVIAMVVVLNEEHRRTHGAPDLERILDLGIADLQSELTAALDEVPDAEAATFRAAVDGGDESRGVVADGPGAGVRDDQGSDLPVDGSPAV